MKLVDLFCGCGGFSLGAHQAGFDVAAAIDIDPILTSSYSRNFPQTQLLLKDLAATSGKEIERAVGGRVDGLFGGPPCQGFSEMGHRDSDDPRRQLLGHFFRLVRELKPTFFVMENVRGLGRKDSLSLLDNAIATVMNEYAILGPILLNAADFGAATSRIRLFVIGMRLESTRALSVDDIMRQAIPRVTVADAIHDLIDPVLIGEEDGYDWWQTRNGSSVSDYARALGAADNVFTGNRRSKHSERTQSRFMSVVPGTQDVVGRHHRLSWTGLCPTLRAGTGADKGSFQSVRPLHPDEPRVITVREAARLQGFPDAHLFHPTIWHSFRMIGNSVSPFVSRAIFSSIKSALGNADVGDVCRVPPSSFGKSCQYVDNKLAHA